MRRRFRVCTLLSVPLFGIAMRDLLSGTSHVGPAWIVWLELALATPVVLWDGWPFFVRAV